jgi:RNA polymerase sigma-70 factor (ECF subfamily)
MWDEAQLTAGRTVLERALALRGRGPYVLQAAIAARQTAPTPDWNAIGVLYDELAAVTRSPVVALNRAVAIAEAGDPRRALALADELAERLDGYRYLDSTRAELLRRLDRPADAAAAYRRALALTPDGPERRFLARRLAELAPSAV